MIDQFEYTLSRPISVSVGSEEVEASDVIIKCPRNCDSRKQLVFEHYVAKAVIGLSNLFSGQDSHEEIAKPDSEEEEEKKVKSWGTLLISSSDPKDFGEMVHLLKELICEGNTQDPQGTLGGTKFTKPIFDSLNASDIKSLVGRYAYHFLSSDLM